MQWSDRRAAGRELAGSLARLRDQDVVVAGLPRGGVPVAAEVAEALDAPLDVVMVRKVGVPFEPEVAMGAIGEDGVRVVDEALVRSTGIGPGEFAEVEAAEARELSRRAETYRRGRPRAELCGRVVIVVDDGLATGSTARAACQVVRAAGAARVVLAVPVAPRGCASRLADVADELVCLHAPADFRAVGQCYADFAQVGDREVLDCLEQADRRIGRRPRTR